MPGVRAAASACPQEIHPCALRGDWTGRVRRQPDGQDGEQLPLRQRARASGRDHVAPTPRSPPPDGLEPLTSGCTMEFATSVFLGALVGISLVIIAQLGKALSLLTEIRDADRQER